MVLLHDLPHRRHRQSSDPVARARRGGSRHGGSEVRATPLLGGPAGAELSSPAPAQDARPAAAPTANSVSIAIRRRLLHAVPRLDREWMRTVIGFLTECIPKGAVWLPSPPAPTIQPNY
ncbi:hypothetical protein GCM10027597_32330 [Saccharopolyspora tripterygii]